MSSDFILGLRISVLGLSITFLAMGLVILIMVLLLRFFPVKGAVADEAAEAGQPESEVAGEQALEEMAVALAVGICLLERDGVLEHKDPSLGKLLEE